MEHRQEAQRNYFGRRLEQLLLSANVKSATVAAALSYDVSYISKWITGKALPSRKNIEKVLLVVSELMVEHASVGTRQALLDSFGVKDEAALREAIAGALRDAYYESTGEINENQYASNAALRVMPRGKFPLLEDFALSLDPEKPMNIVVTADLFSLDHISKLRLAGIESRRFRMREKRERLNVDYIIDLRSLRGDSVYDVILLIHMMTNYSHCNFRLFFSDRAADKLLIAVQGEFAGITMLADHHQFLCTTSTREKKTVDEVYEATRNMIDPDKLIFLPTDMETMLLNHEYFHNLLSQNNRWLVGHVTEHFIPGEMFAALSETCFGEDPEAAREAERAYLLSANILRKSRVNMMLYHRALVDFVLSGELDFFNHKVILTPEQRKTVLQYLRELLLHTHPEQIRMVKDGFSDDFKYITNPCLFLSDSTSYLRLENGLYRDNLLLVKDEQVKKIFDTFFGKIWNDSQDVVIGDHAEILQKLESLIETASLM